MESEEEALTEKSNLDQEGDVKHGKKARRFSAKEFRQQLESPQKVTALQSFLELCTESRKQDCIFEYLEKGGSCLELLQMLETNTVVPPTLILDVVNKILLQIISQYQQFQNAAYEACRYFLNTHLQLINKMLSLASTSKERKSILNLLTAFVTNSGGLAKEILLHVNFNPVNVEMLSKQTGGKDTTRSSFVQFVIAFLIDGHFPTISILLEKKLVLVSVISGLQYDAAEHVCLVITTLRNQVLENPAVTKTLKMKTFSTPVVKSIVNLYNWKGPRGYNYNKKKPVTNIQVDEFEKSKVNECVHRFLLTLCTSHKFGVIFKDPSLGMGKKHQNNLMYTVLESLDRPWEHSYAGELVTQMCGACPDLVRTMWSNLKEFLEPRSSVKWFNAMNYAKVFLKAVQPSCIEFCARDLNIHQITQITQFLVAPTPILKTIIPDKNNFENHTIKHHVLLLLLEMLKSVNSFLIAAQNWLNAENLRNFKQNLNEHIFRNFPNVQTVLNDWDKLDEKSEDSFAKHTVLDNLQVIIEIFESYQNICPQLLHGLSNTKNLQCFLNVIREIPINNLEPDRNTLQLFAKQSKILQTKMVSLYLNFDPTLFTTKNELFENVLPHLLELYYESKDVCAKSTLFNLLQNTAIFEGCIYEINSWIDAIFDLKTFDHSVASFMFKILKETSENIQGYLLHLSDIKKDLDVKENFNFEAILENLLDNNVQNSNITIRHSNLSPLLLGMFHSMSESTVSKNVKKYCSSVLVRLIILQTSSSEISGILRSEKYAHLVAKSVFNWLVDDTEQITEKVKGGLLVLSNLRSALHNSVHAFLEQNKDNLDSYPGQDLELLRLVLYYFIKWVSTQSITHKQANNCKEIVLFLAIKNHNDVLTTVLGHPVLLQHFRALHPEDICTSFIVNVVKILAVPETSGDFQKYIKPIRAKLVASLKKILKKSSKAKNIGSQGFLEIVEVLQLEYLDCAAILKACCELEVTCLVSDGNGLYKLLVHCLLRITQLCTVDSELSALDGNIVTKLSFFLTYLNENAAHFDTSDFAKEFRSYLETFPHNIGDVKQETLQSIIFKEIYCKENTLLGAFLLNRRQDLLDIFVQYIPNISKQKGILLPMLESAIGLNVDITVLKLVYENFEVSIVKALQKPQKAGQSFEKYYKSVGVLIKDFMPLENCTGYVAKVQKFETSEVFHTYLLEIVFSKVLFADENCSEKHLCNAILTLVHLGVGLFKRKAKSDDDWGKISEISSIINQFVEKIYSNKILNSMCFKQVFENETFLMYVRFGLKFGISGRSILIKVLTNFVKLFDFAEKDVSLLLDMIMSHSEFLELLLSGDKDCKVELLGLLLVLCKCWPSLMQRDHVPILLGAYQATLRPADRLILTLLQMYAAVPAQSCFYDFKPFLWGNSATMHYSVRKDIQKALWRQPKMSDVLDILEESRVMKTIKNYPQDLDLTVTKCNPDNNDLLYNVYDLAFFLPLFSSLLAPENSVTSYRFCRSGALSLTIIGLTSLNKDVRAAACHVLARLHFHLEGAQGGKDKLLWLTFVEAVCKGIAPLEEFKLNSLAGIFLARMGLILTQPLHSLYMPLSQYLSAKAAPNLGGIPELYTFLHSSEVNYKEHRGFILEILRDGLKSNEDFSLVLHSMSLKLIMELFTSCVTDLETKKLILEVLQACCMLKWGCSMLCNNYGLLSWIYFTLKNLESLASALLPIVIRILFNLVKFIDGESNSSIIALCLEHIVGRKLFSTLRDSDFCLFIQTLRDFQGELKCVNKGALSAIVSCAGDKYCKTLIDYGCKYVNKTDELTVKDKIYHTRLLTIKWIAKCKDER